MLRYEQAEDGRLISVHRYHLRSEDRKWARVFRIRLPSKWSAEMGGLDGWLGMSNKFERGCKTTVLLRFMITTRKMRIHEWELLGSQIKWDVKPMEE